MKSRRSRNSSSVICKSLRKGEADLVGAAGAEGFNALAGEGVGSPGVRVGNGLCPKTGLCGVAAGCVPCSCREKRDVAEFASGVWLWVRKEVNGLAAGCLMVFAAAPKEPVCAGLANVSVPVFAALPKAEG